MQLQQEICVFLLSFPLIIIYFTSIDHKTIAHKYRTGLLISMGFPEAECKIALSRTHNDVNHAVELLSRGLTEEDDAEFDLIAAAEPEPAVREPTVFRPKQHRDEPDHFVQGIQQGTIAEMVDARISSLTEMGFTAAQAEEALKECNGDVNAALNKLLGVGVDA